MPSVSRKSNDKLVAEFQAALRGIRSLGKKTLVIDGKLWTLAEIEALLQGQIDALQKNTANRASWLRDVAAQRATYAAQAAPFMKGLRAFALSQCGSASDEFLGFGFTPPKRAGRTVASKTQAVAQAQATRKARNTMGRKQKLAIKGVVPNATAQPAAPAPSASAMTPAMIVAASTSSPNGSSGSTH